MSIKYGLLALLEREPMYGYQLRTEFERSTGATWPLNIGQVYTTLSRLHRDGLVAETGEADDQGKVVYQLTDAGRVELERWFTTPVTQDARPRDELAIKIALAVTTPGVDARAVVQAQRTATVRHLQELTRLKTRADDNADTAWLLVLDSMLFRAEAEVRWLDHSETRLARLEPPPAAAPRAPVTPHQQEARR
ncbi:PadR family transcriptional regulator [Actinophytocola xinjiangensis]|uniref:PadR family transcriptional regulator n=1 Tax=Actinophytocola xinjiangensis TaxID=485602 RepID=A0A7Z0WQI0_9PSEU|nr:PadR family transcriptional regulator [Actinophytocola xinjiangensis]OLF13051.1 PadR family transcriptional regulator [Actinophytocola xinjiangensis]